LNQSSRYSCLPETAQALLDSNDGSLLGISDRSLKELMMIPGIGIYRGVTIQAIFELGRRLRNEIPRPKPVVISAQSAFEILRTDFQDLNHEESWALFLNRANGLISKERISMGGVSATTLDPRIIVKRAVDLLASSFIIAHNHPSGNMYPGDLDKKMTVALRQAAALFNISLLDHLIIAGNKFFSFSDEGL
ncbi:MAG: DNA repair protein RadC, partial [Bacteroidales bacterium]